MWYNHCVKTTLKDTLWRDFHKVTQLVACKPNTGIISTKKQDLSGMEDGIPEILCKKVFFKKYLGGILC